MDIDGVLPAARGRIRGVREGNRSAIENWDLPEGAGDRIRPFARGAESMEDHPQ